MIIRHSSVVLTLVVAIGLGFCLGCDPGVRTPSGVPSTPAVNDTTNDVPPGPQTEPEIKPDGDSSTNGKLSVKPIDPAGLKAAIAKHHGQVVLVDYWATWCVPCRKKFPHTVALFNAHQSEGLAVIAVSMDDEDALPDVEEFLQEHHATFDCFRCQDGVSDETFEAFEIPGGALPCLRLYDREGKLVKTFASDPEAEKQFTNEDVTAAVTDALKK